MQNYIVHVYRVHPANMVSLSGVIEAIESGQKQSFHSIDDVKAMRAHSIGKGQPGFPNAVTQALNTHDSVFVAGSQPGINTTILAV